MLNEKQKCKAWASFPDEEEDCCLSLVMKNEGDTLNLRAGNKIERDNFFWALRNIWDSFKLEGQGVQGSCLVIPEVNFTVVSSLTNTCLSLMDIENGDLNSILILMNNSKRICCENVDAEGRQTGYVFVQAFSTQHFSCRSPKFWESVFWCMTMQTLRMKRFEEEEESGEELTPADELHDLVEQILVWSLFLWGWGLDHHDIKEFMKVMHGSRENKITDQILFELLRYVDLVGGSEKPVSEAPSGEGEGKRSPRKYRGEKERGEVAGKQIPLTLKKVRLSGRTRRGTTLGKVTPAKTSSTPSFLGDIGEDEEDEA